MRTTQWLQTRQLRHMFEFCKNLIVISFYLLALMDLGQLAARRNKKPIIHWNDSYYQELFTPCKKLQYLNPVEKMRAQAFAAHVFRRCAPKVVIKLGTKYSVPAFALLPLGELLCKVLTVAWAFAANDGSLIVPAVTPTKTILDLIQKFQNASVSIKVSRIVRHRNEVFKLSYKIINDLCDEMLPCVFPSELIVPVDGDYMKHLIEHGLKMLL